MNCFKTLNCHFGLKAHSNCTYQGKLQAVVTGSWRKWCGKYSLRTMFDQPKGERATRTQEQCGYSTWPSLSSSKRTYNGQSSSFAFFLRAPRLLLWLCCLMTSCSTQYRSPSRAFRGHRDALKTKALPLQFHPAGSHHILEEVTLTNTSSALQKHSPWWLGVLAFVHTA